jgi:hypothetical protein
MKGFESFRDESRAGSRSLRQDDNQKAEVDNVKVQVDKVKIRRKRNCPGRQVNCRGQLRKVLNMTKPAKETRKGLL